MSNKAVSADKRRRRRSWRRRTGLYGGLLLFVGVIAASGLMEWLFYIGASRRTPAPPGVPAVEAVAFASDDGTRLTGWFMPALDADPRSAPTILHVHGNAGNLEGHVYFSGYLPAAGFNVLIFDFRGYGASDGRAVRRRSLIADSEAALDYLLERPDVDPGRIGLLGQSLGGAVGLNVMAHRTELRAAVVQSSFRSWRDIAANAVGGANPGFIAQSLAWLLIRDHDRPDEAISRIDRPILILHGTADEIIPIDHGRALAKAGPTASMVELEGGTHNGLRTDNPETDRLTIAFFREHLDLDDDPDPAEPAVNP